jgi:hypothetical protein
MTHTQEVLWVPEREKVKKVKNIRNPKLLIRRNP